MTSETQKDSFLKPQNRVDVGKDPQTKMRRELLSQKSRGREWRVEVFIEGRWAIYAHIIYHLWKH